METCRICYEPENLASVCRCDGTVGGVHLHCIQTWIRVSRRKACEICLQPFSHDKLFFDSPAFERKVRACTFVSFGIGILHGISVWVDAYYGMDAFAAGAISSTVFNSVQGIFAAFLHSDGGRYWKVHMAFFAGFVLANVPGHIIFPQGILKVGFSYVFNVFFLAIFMGLERLVVRTHRPTTRVGH